MGCVTSTAEIQCRWTSVADTGSELGSLAPELRG